MDLAMMAGLGVVLLLSVVGTGFLRTLRETSSGWLGPLSASANWFWEAVRYLLPAVFSFALFAGLYRFVPRAGVRFRDVWPAALLATVLFEALKNSFAFYVANFNNYNLAYGALGGILLFLLWTYLSVNILLLGAEVAARLSELRAGVLEGAGGPGRPLRQEALDFLKGLVVRQEPGAAPQPRRKP
jgi:membrane protein